MSDDYLNKPKPCSKRRHHGALSYLAVYSTTRKKRQIPVPICLYAFGFCSLRSLYRARQDIHDFLTLLFIARVDAGKDGPFENALAVIDELGQHLGVKTSG